MTNFFAVWKESLCGQVHGIFPWFNQDSCCSNWQHHICLQNWRGVV